jgi:hypothetical protein
MEKNVMIAGVLIVLVIAAGIYVMVKGSDQPEPPAQGPAQPPQTTVPATQATVSPGIPVTVTTTAGPAAVKIAWQDCGPDHHNFAVVNTRIENDGETAVTGDLVLKVYNRANVTLGTFRQPITLPPHEGNTIAIHMWDVNFFEAVSMSSEFPGIEQVPRPINKVGYDCPAFWPA